MKVINKRENKYDRIIKEQSRLKGIHLSIRGESLFNKRVIFNGNQNVL